MGIRSILGLGKKDSNDRKKENNPKNNKSRELSGPQEEEETDDYEFGYNENSLLDDSATTPTTTSTSASSSSTLPPSLLQQQEQQALFSEAPLRMGEDPISKEVNVLLVSSLLDPKESTQERINRVKSGLMTEAEKKAFLKTALTAGNTPESRRPLLRTNGNNNSNDKESSSSTSNNNKKRFFASPFPSDSILRNFVARGGKNSSMDGVPMNAGGLFTTEELKKKREYLDMVTNPDRFHRYRTYPASSSSSSSDNATNNGSINQTTSSSSSTTTSPSTPLPNDLGARLGVAAMNSETLRKQKQERELQRQEETQKKLDEERRAYERRAAEEARLRQQQFLSNSLNDHNNFIRQKRQREEELQLKVEEEKKRAEKARLEELMQAQEEYWNKKLAQEKLARIRRQQKANLNNNNGITSAIGAVMVGKTEREKTTTKAEATEQDFSSTNNFNPDEHNLLEQAKQDREEDWEENQEVIEEVKAKTLGVKPLYATIETEEDFLAEQARNKAMIDRQREEQMERLKALSSPLPSPPPHRPPPPVYRPASVSGPASPLFGRRSPDEELVRREPVVVPKQAVMRETNKPTTPASTTTTPATAATTTAIPVSPASPASEKSMWSQFRGSSNDSKNDAPRPKTSSSAPASTSKVNPPAKTGPIRMKLPLNDDDNDDDDEDGVDVRANKGMSISEAMKRTTSSVSNQQERSKKWGIDMTKFTDHDDNH